ncbi:MAG: methylmalonyl-CoA mutase, partial [Leptospiraceae bacterium]|nr:methylmalonyl-CoA mutase [Leptospiraceae bacterium]
MSGSLDKSLFSEFPPISTEEWENIIIKDLKGADYEKRLVWKTDNDFSLQPYYRREDLKNLSYLESLPGEVPFVRGKNRLKNDWDTCQDISHSSAEDANRFALGALKGEVEALCFITDVSSDTVSGISLQSQKDMETLLKSIFIENFSLHFEAGKSSVAIFAMYVNKAKK